MGGGIFYCGPTFGLIRAIAEGCKWYNSIVRLSTKIG